MILPRDLFLSRHKHILSILAVVLVLFVEQCRKKLTRAVAEVLVRLWARIHEVVDNLAVDVVAVVEDNYYNTEAVVDNLD